MERTSYLPDQADQTDILDVEPYGVKELARAILKDIRRWQDETGLEPQQAGRENPAR